MLTGSEGSQASPLPAHIAPRRQRSKSFAFSQCPQCLCGESPLRLILRHNPFQLLPNLPPVPNLLTTVCPLPPDNCTLTYIPHNDNKESLTPYTDPRVLCCNLNRYKDAWLDLGFQLLLMNFDPSENNRLAFTLVFVN